MTAALNRAVAAANAVAEEYVNPKFRIAQDATERPTDAQLAGQREIRDAIQVVSSLAHEHITDGRTLAIVDRSLEDALLYAGKGIFA